MARAFCFSLPHDMIVITKTQYVLPTFSILVAPRSTVVPGHLDVAAERFMI